MATPELEAIVNELVEQELKRRNLGADAASTVSSSTDAFYLLYAGTIVFLMQAGFGMLEAGSVHSKNLKNILFKNILDPCFGALMFWAFGYAFAYGSRGDGNPFIGDSYFFLANPGSFEEDDSYHSWFFQYAFAAAAATIVSGAVAERCKLDGYFLYTCYITGFVYPVVVHWFWSGDGFMSAFTDDKDLLNGVGVVDFAGSGVVHMTGAVAGLAGALAIGPRYNRFNDDGSVNDMPGHNMALVVLGTFLLWVGWYGFNPGSTLGITASGYAHVAAKTAATTTLAAATGGVTMAMIGKMSAGYYDLGEACNGVLAGLVSITAGCSVVETWGAVIIGFMGAFIYWGGATLLLKLKIDDPINAIPVHGFCGAWGVISVGLFATSGNMSNVYGSNKYGCLTGGDGTILGNQIAAVLLIFAWVFGTTYPFFLLINKLGFLRADLDMEIAGMDDSEHGGMDKSVQFFVGGDSPVITASAPSKEAEVSVPVASIG